VCHGLFFKHNWTLLHEFRWKGVECRASRFSIDASGDSTYEAWDKTVKSETVELNLQHGCKTLKQQSKQFILGIHKMYASIPVSHLFYLALEAGWQWKKQNALGTCELRHVYTKLYEPIFECLTLLKTCFWQWSIAKQMYMCITKARFKRIQMDATIYFPLSPSPE